MKGRLTLFTLFVLMLIPTTSALYSESGTFSTYDNTDYYYTFESTYTTWYIGELMAIDVELVVDYFGYDSYSFYDIELFLLIEDFDGFVVYEASHFVGLDIVSDGGSVLVEWDVDITADFPATIYVSIAADFYEEIYDYYYYYYDYYDYIFYSDEYIEMATIYVDGGERVGGNDAGRVGGNDDARIDSTRTDYSLFGLTALLVPVILMKPKK